MYKVIIVDDELLVINSLKNRIDWKEQGFEIIGEARNGISAYDKIVELKPDIVFTDIRMAGMSGLELIKKVNELSLNILFVVISGYAEFAYAQKALNYGALGFCLKPFEENEIIGILKSSKKKIEKIKEDQEMELLSYLEDLSEEGRLSRVKMMEKLGFTTDRNAQYINVVSKGSTCLSIPSELKSVSLRIGKNKYLYIIETDVDTFISYLKYQKNEKVYDLINLPSDVKGLGISKTHDSFDTLKSAFEEANVAAYQFFIKGNKSIICRFQDMQLEVFDAVIKELLNSLVQKDVQGIVKQMDSLVELFRNENYTIQQAIKVYNIFIYLFDREIDEKQENNLESIEQLTGLFKDVQEMLLYLKGLTSKNENTKISIPEQESVNDTYMRIVKFINENYSNDISVQSIASRLQSNPNYISQMFKKERGETFTEYLTAVRVKHACTMLRSEDLPVYEVAEKSGYKDYFHFAKMFKKSTGKTPTEYRDGK